jgi:PAS domain-containing protein
MPLPITRGRDALGSELFAGGGEAGALMRSMDWSATPLGPPEGWPRSLKTCVRILLTSRQAMFVWWGDHLINLHNDAYRSILGGKHPWALGQPASSVWREIWDQVGPRAESAMRGNEGTYDEALLLLMERNGYTEETYYTFSYSPVPNDEGGTGGIICANTDDTQRIVGGRQLALLQKLAARASEARTIDDVCIRSARSLETNQRDLPGLGQFLRSAAVSS